MKKNMTVKPTGSPASSPQTAQDILLSRLMDVRAQTERLVYGLNDADVSVQSMEDASPAKWHLAHTSWFFETFVLSDGLADYKIYDARFPFLFNSYYEALGSRIARPQRGVITRPDLADILAYRAHVNAALQQLFTISLDQHTLGIIELGMNHEHQHQELLLTDILHLFAQNPLFPAFKPSEPLNVDDAAPVPMNWVEFSGGLQRFGHEQGDGFGFDCEGPNHQRWSEPFRLATRCVTNAEWIAFIEAQGYQTPTLWLSDGWVFSQSARLQAPLYWEKRDGEWWSMTLRGMQSVDLKAPVTHISYYEADAYAHFCGKRLPTEFEWELAARNAPVCGNFLESGRLRPAPAPSSAPTSGLVQLYGDVWEWTQSPFSPFPNFQPNAGAVGEYNGKFMDGQYVLKGGSCVTPVDHIRASYRNFFNPQKRWQFSGLRLAENV